MHKFSELIFVSAQPDIPYFHWQTKVYCNNFIELGISPNKIHVLFLLGESNSPEPGSLKLKDLGVNVHYYINDGIELTYISSLRPYIISKWLEDFPEFSKLYFYHDSDIIFRELPKFEDLIKDDIIYTSDSVSYLGYEYIEKCCRNYENSFPTMKKNKLIELMSSVVNIDIELIKVNQNNSGGAQYLMKGQDSNFWKKIYIDCVKLHTSLSFFDSTYKLERGGIQIWTVDMWVLLWNLWSHGFQTIVTDELEFSWGTDDITTYEKRPIFHLAGVTEKLKDGRFYKPEFVNVSPFDKLDENINYFDYVDKNSATFKYVEQIRRFHHNC
jgi:hypothetical protein